MKTELHPVEVVILCAVALLWAAVTIARSLLIPCLAVLLTLVRHRPAPTPPAAPQPAPVAAQPVLAPVTLAAIADDLLSLSAAQLRSVTGCRRKVAKKAMVEAWLAMPI